MRYSKMPEKARQVQTVAGTRTWKRVTPKRFGALTYSFPKLKPDVRLAEMILYIADRCDGDRPFGATKLNKILAFADFSSYFQTGQPVTGSGYMRLQQGPVPCRLKPVTAMMEARHEMHTRMVSYGKYQQKRVIPLRDARLEHFTPDNIALVDLVIKKMWGRTALQVSEFSHGIAWRVAGDRMKIPYEAVFLSDDEITDYDLARTNELADVYGWERD